MKILTWLRKNVKKLTGSSRGFSSIIGTIFMVLLVMTLATNVFLWTLYQNASYNQAVEAQNQQELDARNENVVCANGSYAVPSIGKVNVTASLTNDGALPATIVSLWVLDTSKGTYGSNTTVGNVPWANLTMYTLKPGRVLSFTGRNAKMVTVPSAASGDSFDIWFETARGNTVPLTQSSTNMINTGISQRTGPASMNFSSFLYYNVSSSSVRGQTYYYINYSRSASGYGVPRDNYVAFSVRITNYDPNQRTIVLASASLLWCLFPLYTTWLCCAGWFIVNVNATGYIANTFTSVTLPYGVPTNVFFASSQNVNSQGFAPSKASGWAWWSYWTFQNATAPANLMLIGTIGGATYGQNLPFVAIYFSATNWWRWPF